MASVGGKIGLVMPVIVPATMGALGFAAWRVDWTTAARTFFTGQGRTVRLVMLASVLLNLKCLPLAWTTRVFNALIYHYWLRPSPQLSPRALFVPIITSTHASLLEIDYNLHKSNSTYFADLDVSRSHLVMYLCRPGVAALTSNATTKLVLDPNTGTPFKGKTGIVLGAVACSFRREIAPYAGYEMWSRVLAWDRKWLYIVTHFVPTGTARPTEWLDPKFGPRGLRKEGEKEDKGWESKVYASAVSKYVFKMGRFTVHPAIVLEASGLLPERPGGWTSGENALGEEYDESVVTHEAIHDGEWNWQRIEASRRQGMEMATNFQALDGLQTMFDGGDGGALGKF